MKIKDLASQEIELLNQTLELDGTIEEKNDKVVYLGIGAKYKTIHQEYSQLAKSELEALKRGLFIMWYALTEPSCYTGIVNLDTNAEYKVINALDLRFKNNKTDYELEWMIDYYANWHFVFERFTEFEHLQARLAITKKLELPLKINRIEMKKRGQMGYYWNSLTRFKNQRQ